MLRWSFLASSGGRRRFLAGADFPAPRGGFVLELRIEWTKVVEVGVDGPGA